MNKYLLDLIKKSKAVKKQFEEQDNDVVEKYDVSLDPLLEEEFRILPGLIHKYTGRVLIELTNNCAVFCQFCTRRRKTNSLVKRSLDNEEIKKIIEYLSSKIEINEVIVSGGDPLTEQNKLIYLIGKIKKIKHIKIIRIHTRIPIVYPDSISLKLLKVFKKIKKQSLYISIHIEHPDELTLKTKKIIQKLIGCNAVLLSQTVFLKNINDDVYTLKTLFSKLAELKVRPYYIYRCDPVIGAEKYMVPWNKEIDIMSQLRKELSGIACPTYVVDVPNGVGKIPVPLNFWGKSGRKLKDFVNKRIEIIGP